MAQILPRVGGGGFHAQSQQHMQSAISARHAMHPGSKTETTPPGKTFGGGLMSGLGGAAAGASTGAAMGAGGGPIGAAIGAVVGILAYALS